MYLGRLRKCAIIYSKSACIAQSVKKASMQVPWFWLFPPSPPLGIPIICISFCYLATKSPVMGYICCIMPHAVSLLPQPTQNPWADTPCSIHSLLLTWQLWTELPLCKPSSCSTCTQVQQGWRCSTTDDAKAIETSLKSLCSAKCVPGEQTVVTSIPAGLPALYLSFNTECNQIYLHLRQPFHSPESKTNK